MAQLLLAAALVAASATMGSARAPVCVREPKAVEISELMWRTCQQEHYRWWAEAGDRNAPGLAKQCGCWRKVNENGHRKDNHSLWRSVLWQDMETNQCSLHFSGFAGMNGSANVAEFHTTLWFPPGHVDVCGAKLWKPFVTTLRQHIRMENENFTEMMEQLAGPKSTCKGDIIVSGVSLGGSMAEMIAGCASRGELHKLFDGDRWRTNWTVGEMYTFAPQAAAKMPMKNALDHERGKCFKGKRFYIKGDALGGSMSYVHNRHPHLETVEFFRGKEGPSYRVYPCYSEAATRDDNHRPPSDLSGNITHLHPLDMRKDKLPHDMVFHKEFLRWFVDAGVLNFSSLEFPVKHEGRLLVPSDELTDHHSGRESHSRSSGGNDDDEEHMSSEES